MLLHSWVSTRMKAASDLMAQQTNSPGEMSLMDDKDCINYTCVLQHSYSQGLLVRKVET